MIAPSIFGAFLTCMALIPPHQPSKGRNQTGGVREFAFTKAGQDVDFTWRGPRIISSVNTSSVAASVSVNASSTTANSSQSDAGEKPYSWIQLCNLSVDEEFNENVDFTLQLSEDGLKDHHKDSHARFVCGAAKCFVKEEPGCTREYVIPKVRSTA